MRLSASVQPLRSSVALLAGLSSDPLPMLKEGVVAKGGSAWSWTCPCMMLRPVATLLLE
ncbi:MAG: hypothetical protein BWX70_03114 [Verrucomicrobia bacterium ADurb.Bin070]|nr:MAG: hypothetical protein BWX70_03114 [Verrucomicrobia bacterium ADurb.Bin070]